MTSPGGCSLCGTANTACGGPSSHRALDLPARAGSQIMTGPREKRWVNHGSARRPSWGLYEMTAADPRYAASLPWVAGQRPDGKAGLVEGDPDGPVTPGAGNKAVSPGRPVTAPRKNARGKAPAGE